MQVVDTDILVDIQRGYRPALDWFAPLDELPLIPGFVVLELLQAAKNKQDVVAVKKLVEPLRVVWPKPEDCNRVLGGFAEWRLAHNIGLLDALIAATAMGCGASTAAVPDDRTPTRTLP